MSTKIVYNSLILTKILALQVNIVVVSSKEICHILFRNLTTAMYDPMDSISFSKSEEFTTAFTLSSNTKDVRLFVLIKTKFVNVLVP